MCYQYIITANPYYYEYYESLCLLLIFALKFNDIDLAILDYTLLFSMYGHIFGPLAMLLSVNVITFPFHLFILEYWHMRFDIFQ